MPYLFDPYASNLMPQRYGQVSTAEVVSLEPAALVEHFGGREAYMQTRFVVARCDGDCALVELARVDHPAANRGQVPLFSPPEATRVLAGASECVMRRHETVDVGVASQMAAVALREKARCVIVEGRYRHISFILNADPLVVEVVDVVPPRPSKLVDQVRRVLDFDEGLPPVVITETVIDTRDLVAGELVAAGDSLVAPCRGGGVEVDGTETVYLDQRPSLPSGTLLGCARSRQIHEWFYGSKPANMIDTCPRSLMASPGDAGRQRAGDAGVRLSRCCLLESGVLLQGRTAWVRWGATLAEVAQALRALTGADR